MRPRDCGSRRNPSRPSFREPHRSAGTTRWLAAENLDYYVKQYRKGGFRGPLNWYRNIDRNNKLTWKLEKAKIEQPAFFITGKKDFVMSFSGEWFNKWISGYAT